MLTKHSNDSGVRVIAGEQEYGGVKEILPTTTLLLIAIPLIQVIGSVPPDKPAVLASGFMGTYLFSMSIPY